MPIVLLITLGAALRYFDFFNDNDVACMSKLVYWIISPSILFRFAMGLEIDWAANLNLAKAVYLAVIFTMVSVFLVGRYVLRTPKDILPISVYCSFRSNSMMVGVPVAALVLGERAMPFVAVYFAVTEIGYNFITAIAAELVMARGSGFLKMIGNAVRGAVRNPFVIGSALGLLCAELGFRQMPELLDKVLVIISNMAIATSVLMIGASLKLSRFEANLKVLSYDIFVRFALFPAAMLWSLTAFNVSGTLKQVIVILSAASGANITFILARELGLNSQYGAEFTALTTVLFVAAMPFWLYVLGLV